MTKHVAIAESMARGGRMLHRAKCTTKGCTWTSTWQSGDVSMADNAARMHERQRERDT